jgi:amidase
MTVWAAGLAAGIDAFAMAAGTTPSDNDLEGLTYGLYEVGKAITASQYQMALGGFQILGREMAKFHQTYDVWMTTTLGAPPPPLGMVDTSNREPIAAFEPIINYVPFTAIENATGQPAVSLPLHWTQSGLPVGVMFAAGFGEEGLLYRLAGQLEKAKPWINKHPQVWN